MEVTHYRVRDELLLAVGDPSKAEESFTAALKRQSAKLWELHPCTSLACLWSDQGKADFPSGQLTQL